MSEIITAEVVEVPKPERPELWVAFQKRHDAPGWFSSHPYEDRIDADGYFGERTILVRIPGTAAQPAPSEDAVEELKDYSRVILGSHEDGGWFCSVEDPVGEPVASAIGDTYQAAAAACLAKIRGGR